MMQNPVLWQNLMLILIAASFAIYSILDGFDIGIGLILPFFNNKNGPGFLGLISPFWDGNEVWLLIGASLLLGSFPQVFAGLLSLSYLPVFIGVIFFMARAASFGFWYHGGKWKSVWEWVFVVTSYSIGIAFFLAFGFLLQGASPAIFVLAGISAVVMQGLTFSLDNTKSSFHAKIRNFLKISSAAGGILTVSFCASFFLKPFEPLWPMALAGALLMISGFLLIFIFSGSVGGKPAFLISSAVIAGLWLLFGGLSYPILSVKFFNASSALPTLKALALLSIPGMSVIIFYTVFIYRSLAGKG
jgi:cytochrome d ubiquinol oxidase subunit II